MRTLMLAAALVLPVPALAQETRSCQPADLAALADWRGVWVAGGMVTDINGREPEGVPPLPFLLVGTEAPWKEEGWAALEAMIRTAEGGEVTNHGWGFPMMMGAPAPMRFIISPLETVITSQYSEIRYIPTDGRPQLPEEERWPTVWGTSVGCWEGDTLVIATDSVGRSQWYNFITPPLSEDAHFVERIRLVGPDRLENIVTITDPAMLESSWTETVNYFRHPVLDRLVHEVDAPDADRVVMVNGQPTIAPPAEQQVASEPVFPERIALPAEELDRFVGTYQMDGAPIRLIFERRGERLFVRADPVGPSAVPVYAHGPDAFHSRALVRLQVQFAMDADGRAASFTGISPEGMPMSGRRQ